MKNKKRNKIFCVIGAVLVAFSTVLVSNAFALTPIVNGTSQPYYIVVGARKYDFVDVYVDNNTNTVMWVFDRDILALAIFNDYNYVASGMNSSFIQTDVVTDINNSFMIGAMFDSRYLPSTNTFNFANSVNWQPYLYYDSNLGFSNARSLSYTSLSTSYAYTQLPHMSKGTQYFDQAIDEGEYWKPCIIIHLSQSFNIDYFSDYACIGAGIQMIEITEVNAYQSGYEVGYNQAIGNNIDNYNNGYNAGHADGLLKGEDNKESYGDTRYNEGLADGEQNYINNTLPSKEKDAYDNGYAKGEQDYIDNELSTILNTEYWKGYGDGIGDGTGNGFNNLLTAVIDVPIKSITGLFNYEILGVNLKDFYFGFFSLALVVIAIRWFL